MEAGLRFVFRHCPSGQELRTSQREREGGGTRDQPDRREPSGGRGWGEGRLTSPFPRLGASPAPTKHHKRPSEIFLRQLAATPVVASDCGICPLRLSSADSRGFGNPESSGHSQIRTEKGLGVKGQRAERAKGRKPSAQLVQGLLGRSQHWQHPLQRGPRAWIQPGNQAPSMGKPGPSPGRPGGAVAGTDRVQGTGKPRLTSTPRSSAGTPGAWPRTACSRRSACC